MSWLNEYCDTGLEPAVLAEKMAMTGTEVERVEVSGPPTAENFVIARVDSVEKHPDADRLNVCQVNTGDTVRTIVCGAPNVAAGQTVVAALPGADQAIAEAGTPSQGGGLMGALGSLMGGSGGIMALGSELTAAGLSMGQMQTLGQELFAYGREKAGEDVMGAIIGEIPGLSQFV